MSHTLDDIVSLASELNPNFELPEHWEQRAAKLSSAESFLRQAQLVIQAEADHSYFHTRHFKKTVKQKAGLPYTHCCLLTELIGNIFPQRIALANRRGILGSAQESTIGPAADTVTRDGIYVLPLALSEGVVEEIRGELNPFEFKNRATKQTRTAIAGQSDLEGAWWINDPLDIAKSDVMQRLAFDPTLLGITQRVLGATPIHVQTNAWWTFPTGGAGESAEAIQKRNAQWFHQDMEFINFVKVFVYLSDVGDSNGPHVYVKGSVNDYEEKLPGIEVSTRVSDADVVHAFGEDRIHSITGQAGTVAIVNTRGYHRGAPVVQGHRLLLQFEYACSLYFNPVPSFPLGCLSLESKDLCQQNPRLFMNYRSNAIQRQSDWRGLVSRVAGAWPRRSHGSKKAA